MMLSRVISKLRFSGVDENRVVILHHSGHWIRKLVLRDIPATTIDFSTGIPVTPALVARMLLRLRLIKWPGIGASASDSPRLAAQDSSSPGRADPLRAAVRFMRALLKALFREVQAQYVLACIDQAKAKVVLTFIDNSSFFQKLSRADRKRTYFAIQNGARTLACVRDSLPLPPHPSSVISMTNFLCFGQRDIDLFVRHGHTVDNYFPVGSLIGGYYRSVLSAPAAEPKFDLCLISQWHDSFFREISGDDFTARVSRRYRAALTGLYSFVLRLLEETGLKLVIGTRFDHNADELSFYRNLFDGKATIVESEAGNYSTYRAVEQSRLAIGLNSTMLSELLSWGKKVLWCNVPDDEHYEMPEAGISYFRGDDYNGFKERVLALLKMPQEEFEMRTRDGARYINNYDPANPPHEIIRAAVMKARSVAG